MKTNILFIDSDLNLLWALSHTIFKDSNTYNVITIQNEFELSKIIQSKPIRLLTINAETFKKSASIESIIQLKEKNPDLTVLCQTNDPKLLRINDKKITSIAFIQKPIDVQSFEIHIQSLLKKTNNPQFSTLEIATLATITNTNFKIEAQAQKSTICLEIINQRLKYMSIPTNITLQECLDIPMNMTRCTKDFKPQQENINLSIDEWLFNKSHTYSQQIVFNADSIDISIEDLEAEALLSILPKTNLETTNKQHSQYNSSQLKHSTEESLHPMSSSSSQIPKINYNDPPKPNVRKSEPNIPKTTRITQENPKVAARNNHEKLSQQTQLPFSILTFNPKTSQILSSTPSTLNPLIDKILYAIQNLQQIDNINTLKLDITIQTHNTSIQIQSINNTQYAQIIISPLTT